jgi:RecQ-mediated genome instability protein 1
VVSPFFSNTSSSTAAASSTLALAQTPPFQASLPSSRLNEEFNTEDDEFGDDLDIDEAFFQELDAAEHTFQERERQGSNVPVGQSAAPTIHPSEVILIDSDSDDKENLAPVPQRRVRRRIALPEDGEESDVIVID